jgi:phosphoribosylformylglycinamidine synthase
MAACSIDTAIRNAISVGGNLDSLALLDNFCWCSSDEPERLGQLKAAVQACYDYAIVYETPFISGKDSMFNDFVGYDEDENKIKISVPPTLLISSIGVVDDSTKAVDLALKASGDLIYLIGETKEELGGSEYFAYLGAVGNSVPQVDAKEAARIYRKFTEATSDRLVSASISVVQGGFGPALAKMAIAGGLGVDVDLRKVKSNIKRADYLIFSESQSRFVVAINPKNQAKFEKVMAGTDTALIGRVRSDHRFIVTGLSGASVIDEDVKNLATAYKETLKDY